MGKLSDPRSTFGIMDPIHSFGDGMWTLRGGFKDRGMISDDDAVPNDIRLGTASGV